MFESDTEDDLDLNDFVDSNAIHHQLSLENNEVAFFDDENQRMLLLRPPSADLPNVNLETIFHDESSLQPTDDYQETVIDDVGPYLSALVESILSANGRESTSPEISIEMARVISEAVYPFLPQLRPESNDRLFGMYHDSIFPRQACNESTEPETSVVAQRKVYRNRPKFPKGYKKSKKDKPHGFKKSTRKNGKRKNRRGKVSDTLYKERNFAWMCLESLI